MPRGSFAFVGVVAVFWTSACSAPVDRDSEAKAEDSLSQLDSSAVEEIPGNDGHNLLAREGRLERGMALAAAVKGTIGKQYCSPERTMYRGKNGRDSFWTIQCHDGAVYQVQIKRDGSGNVMDCADPKSLGLDVDCWKPFDGKGKQAKK
ncbi:MAG: hypothetical protein ACREDU_05780 [Methylocella sp.]